MSLSVTPEDLAAMSVGERLELVNMIWDTIEADWRNQDPGPAREPSQALKNELDRRLAAHEANPDDVVSWEEVKSAALARLKS